MSTATVSASDAAALRREAFCSAQEPDLFSSIVHQPQVWTPDPFDVPTIHREARDAFERLLNRATSFPRPQFGKVLLLKGEGGSGKTHLMRAFRNAVHGTGRGYCGYLQMTSQADNYDRYLLANLIDALDQPYQAPDVVTPGLMRLSLGLLECVPGLGEDERLQFRDGYVPDPEVVRRVFQYADCVLTDDRFREDDLDLYRALLFLQRDDRRIKSRVLKWLRCEDMPGPDRELLGGLAPRTAGEEPLRMVVRLGRLMAAVHEAALVLCVDQLEDMANQDQPVERFRKVVDTLVAVSDQVPTTVVVLGCLEDFYTAYGPRLADTKRDRLERDIAPVRLTGQRDLAEIVELLRPRLRYLYEEAGVPFEDSNPTFPFTQARLEALAGLRTRQVLDCIRTHRDRCIAAGGWSEPDWTRATPVERVPPSVQTLEQAWNDFAATGQHDIPDEEADLAELLAWAIRACSHELPAGGHFSGEAEDRVVPVETHQGDDVRRLYVAICDRRAQGGGLQRQLEELERLAGETPVAVVRSTDFPANKNTDVYRCLARLRRRGWRTVVVENADWRAMQALRAFRQRHAGRPDLDGWQREVRPLSRLASLRAILNLDELLSGRPTTTHSPAVAPTPQSTVPATLPTSPADAPRSAAGLRLGTRRSATGGSVEIAPEDLKFHAAFLGATGSGKTTVALNLIEQLLERGVPAVLVDRKGDLCRYADPAAWQSAPDDPALRTRQGLRERLDVVVYTPGEAAGRPLGIPILPPAFHQLPTADQEQLAQYAASALAGMMGYRSRADESRRVILAKAIEVLGRTPDLEPTLPMLRQLVDDRDDALLAAVGNGFRDNQYQKLSEELLTLWLGKKSLLEKQAEMVTIDRLLGRGEAPSRDKVRLCVLSTRFLTDPAAADFWVAQLLLNLTRWIGKNPSPHLQGVFFFDEADQYLPADRKPATKAPMESLLKRARSAGVGIMLATQSPGDLDYKCRDNIGTWAIGRVREETALSKLRPMLSECKTNVAGKLPGQETGQFHLVRNGEATPFQADRSVIETVQLPEERIIEIARSTLRL